MEWLQNSKINDFIVTIDSDRTSFVIFHRKQLYDIIPYNDNWAVQDLVEEVSEKQLELLQTLSL